MVEGEVDRTEYEVDLILHNNPNVNSAALAPYVAQAAGVDVNELEIVPDKIRLTVQQDKLDDLASLDSVNRIEEVRPKQTTNDQARVILQAETLFTSTGYQGAGQTICVADTGFDQGSAEDSLSSKVHPAFTGRVQLLQSFWTEKDFKDPVGHGTHVCGSACANGVYLDSAEGKSVYIKGTAPAANLMVQSISRYSKVSKSWTVKTPLDLFLLFSGPYKEGVRIHNDSWNNRWDEKTGQFGYESDATMVDKFVHEHQDFIVLISAGNDALEENAGTSQIGGNGAAKNCITVGATGTTRRNNGQRFDPSGPVYSRAEDTATFSSRGPTKSTVDSQGQSIPGRIKPDVVAPGVAILSAASRSLDANAWIRKRYGFSNDNDWLYMSGTSQATPLVSGCVALLREALEEYGKRHPSAALVKALLINGAVNHSCQNEFGFDGLQGFGRIDVDRSITMIKQSTFVEGGSRFETTQHDVSALRLTPTTESWWESSAIEIPNGRNRLVATLAYPDEPGALLQNDINLVVKVGEVERHGNMGSEVGFDHTSKLLCSRHILPLKVPQTM